MYPIQIRVGSEHGAEVDFATAVQLAMGRDERAGRVYVTAVFAEDTETGRRNGEPVVSKAGAPVFGLDAEVMPRETRYGGDADARVSIGGIASHSPEVAMVRVQCYMLAAQIAAAANAAAKA